MYKCKKCGAEFDSKFCPECGTPACEPPAITTNSAETSKQQTGLTCNQKQAVAENIIANSGVIKAWKTARPKEAKVRLAAQISYYLLMTINISIIIYAFFNITKWSHNNPETILSTVGAALSTLNTCIIASCACGIAGILIVLASEIYAIFKITHWINDIDLNVVNIISSEKIKKERAVKVTITSRKLLAAAKLPYIKTRQIIFTICIYVSNIVTGICLMLFFNNRISNFPQKFLSDSAMDAILIFCLIYIAYCVIFMIATKKTDTHIVNWAKQEAAKNKTAV